MDERSNDHSSVRAESSPYSNRYFRVILDNIQQFIKNGSHQVVDDLTKINSFLLIDDINNFCISFSHL